MPINISQLSDYYKRRRASPPHSAMPDAGRKTRDDGKPGFRRLQELVPKNPSSRSFSARIFPNGEFGLGYLPKDREKVADKRYERNEICDRTFELVGRPHEVPDYGVLRDTTDMVMMPAPNRLDPALELSHPPSKRYGLKGITSYGKKVVRNIAFMMEKRMSKGRVSMGTLTVPGRDESELLVICENWAYLQKRFFEECKRRYERFGKKFRYVAVTEIQPKRWRDKRQVGLHIHFLFPTYKVGGKKQWILPDNWVRATWRRQIYNLLCRYYGDGTYQRQFPTPIYDRQTVKKSAAAYMGKYMSKGSDICAEIIEEKGTQYLPSQWWSCDSASRADLKSAMILSRGQTAEMLLHICDSEMDEYYTYLYRIYVPGRIYEELHIGFSGRLNDEGIKVIREFHDAQSRPPTAAA